MMLKRLICAFVTLSFVFAGVPVMAAAKETPCPMMKMHSKMQVSPAQSDMSDMKMDMKDCDKCPKSTEKKQADKTKKGCCCDDAACNAKCAATGSSASLFPSGTFQWSVQVASKKLETLPYLLPPSQLGKTPERPPKNLS